jgi:hypothetical protein
MRTPKVIWKSYFDIPDANRPLVFDFGTGPMFGTFWRGRFFTGHDSKGIDRILVNRWRYCEAHEEPLRSVA